MCARLIQLSCTFLSSLALYVATAQACSTKAVYTDCPSAMDAAQFLTSNNSMLPISNASWSPSCPRVVSTNSYIPYVKITDFKGCHYLASKMSQGALVLSNGNARTAADVVNSNTNANTKLGITQVDSDLEQESNVTYPNAVLYDTVKLMFDITPTVSGPLRFQYVFGSEEYPEYAPGGTGTQVGKFNDVFAFFISPATPSNNPTNIALLPGTNTTVSIGSVNQKNSTFYVANHPGSSVHATALDGMTQLLNTSTYFITAGATYRIKLAIADMADDEFDSLVWVKAGSLTLASPPIVDCIGNYTSWSPCSQGCGGGNQSRTYNVTRTAANGGAACPVANGTMEWQSCNTAPCPVDCIGAFSSWGACSAACGGGTQNRTYMIQTAAANGGQACDYINGTVELQPCNTAPCPVDCIGAFSSWETCSSACNGGSQNRTYMIQTAAANGGQACDYINGTVETQSCNTAPCPVACVGSYDAWSSCNETCGGGWQQQTYTITTPAANGGAACPEPHGKINLQQCNTQPCAPAASPGISPSPGPPQPTSSSPSDFPSPNVSPAGSPEAPQAMSPDVSPAGSPEAPQAMSPDVSPAGSPEAPQAMSPDVSPAGSPEAPQAMCPDVSPAGSPEAPQAMSPDVSPAGSPEAPQAMSPDVSPAGSPEAPQAMSPDVSPAGSPEAPQAKSPDVSPAGSPEAPQALSPESVSPSIPPPAAGAGSPNPATSSPLVSQASPEPPPAPTQSPSSSAAPPLAPTPSVPSSSPALLMAPPSPPPTQPPKPTPPSILESTVFDNIPYIDSPPVLPPLPPISDSNITIRGGHVSITGVTIEGVGASIGNGSIGTIPSIQASGNTLPQKKLTLRWAAFNGSLGFYTLGVDIEVYGEFTLHRTMNWTWDSAWKAWTTEVSIVGQFLLTQDEEVDGVVVSTTRLEPSIAGQLSLFSAIYPGPGFSGKYDWAGHLDMDPDQFAFWGINTLNTAKRLNTASPLTRSLLQSNTGNTPVQGRVSVREVNSKEAPTLSDLRLEAGAQVAIDEDIAVIVPPPDSNYWRMYPPGNTGDPPVKGNKLQGIILVLARIVAPSALAVCIVAVAAAMIYRRKKRKEEQQQQERDKEAETCEQTTGSEVGTSPSSGGATAASTRSHKSRRRTPAPGQAIRQDANSAVLELSSPGANNQQFDFFATLQEGATPLNQVEFLDVNEAGQSMSFTSYPNLRRPAPKHSSGTREKTEQEADGSMSGSKHKGRFGSLTGSVAGMASSIAGAISNLISSQNGQSYLYTGSGLSLPGMSSTSGAGGNRSVVSSVASLNVSGSTEYPGALDNCNIKSAGMVQNVGHAYGPQLASTCRTAKHMQQSVPAQWALPQLDPGAQTRSATWATCVAASWASDLKALSRGPTPPTGAPDEGSPADDIRGKPVTGGLTFLLPSRTRDFLPLGPEQKA